MLLLGMKTIIIKIRNSIVRLIVKLELKREAMNQKICSKGNQRLS